MASEVELRAQIEELTSRDTISAVELKNFLFLLWDLDVSTSDEPDQGYAGEMRLLSSKHRVCFQLADPEENYALITWLIEPKGNAGEGFHLKEKEGQLVWYPMTVNSFFSPWLEKWVEADGELLAEEPLSEENLAALALEVWKAYQESSK